MTALADTPIAEPPLAIHPEVRSGDKHRLIITLDVNNASRYHLLVIRSFRDLEAERLFFRLPSRRLPTVLHRRALRKLLILDAAEVLEDLLIPPGNRLEKLRGDRRGQFSIRINDRWRICFRWDEGDAHEVEIVDYH